MHTHSYHVRWHLCVLILWLGACTGSLGGSKDIPNRADVEKAQLCQDDRPGVPTPPPLKRLSHREYRRTIKQLLGVDATPYMISFSNESLFNTFDFEPKLQEVKIAQTIAYKNAAESITDEVLSESNRASFVGCDPSTDACLRTFSSRIARLLLRRELTNEEKEDFFAVTKVDADRWVGLKTLLFALLQMPDFLFRPEIGSLANSDRPPLPKLDGYEMASRLSFLLWGMAPDEPLLGAAASLTSPANIASKAAEMAQDPRASDHAFDILSQWLATADILRQDRSDTVISNFDQNDYKTAMLQELREFVSQHAWKDSASFLNIFESTQVSVNAKTAGFYGVTAPSGATTKTVDMATLTGQSRAGLFGVVGWLTTAGGNKDEPSVVHRGRIIKEHFLCELVPPAPTDVPPNEQMSGESPQEALNRHKTDPKCRSCHMLMDPIGEGLAQYDAIGRFRTKYSDGKELPTAGVVPSLDANFLGASPLGKLISESSTGQKCISQHLLRWMLARTLDTTNTVDTCTLEAFHKVLVQNNYDLKKTLLSMATADTFRYRTPMETSP